MLPPSTTTTRAAALLLLAMVATGSARIAAASGAAAAAAPASALRELGAFSFPHAAFVNVVDNADIPTLLLSSFKAFGSGSVAYVPDLHVGQQNASQLRPVGIASLNWPNYVSMAPPSAVPGHPSVMACPDGFLVPGHTTGNVYLVDAPFSSSPGKPVPIAAPKKNYFYHKVEWRDIDHDGLLDIVTARTNDPVFGKAAGELIWLKQPASDPLGGAPWAETLLAAGPDVWFTVAELDPSKATFQVFAAQFFSSPSLSLYTFAAANASLLSTRVLDSSIGGVESVTVVDLFNNGSQQLLVNNHLGGNGGSVYAYTVPDDLAAGTFERTTLATGFKVTEGGPNQASPGFVYPFFAHKNDARPLIGVAGDGAQRAYVLTPTSDTQLSYNMTTFLQAKGVVGALAIADIGLDGYADIFAPDYDSGIVHVFTFAP